MMTRERRVTSTPGYREIMANIELDDFYDPWGTAMGWLFGIAEAAWYVDGHIMPHFRPSPIPTSRRKVMDDHASAMIVGLYESGAITMQDMTDAYNVMSRYADWCKLAGRDY